ncbi:MAG: MFS transporter [Pygmaiobacter sp.]
MLKKFTREEKSWMMYDWANSAHSVIIVTLLPIFYATVASCTNDSTSAMSTWGYFTSGAMLICALLAPLLGAIGDFRGYRKKLFIASLLVGVAACVGLAITPMTGFFDNPEKAGKVGFAILILYVLSQIGYSAANLYYDSFLTDVTTEERMDRVSTMGYGLGYIGGSTIPLLCFLLLNLAGVDVLYCLSFAFGFTAVWWLVFSWPLIKNVEQKSYVEHRRGAVRDSLRGLGKTVKEIFAHKDIFVFLIAYFFYIDGVGTIIHMSTIYGNTLGLDSTMMMLAMLLVQLLGLPFCLLYINLADRFGARKMVGVGIVVYMLICVFGFFVRSVWQFWVLAILVSTSQGGIQALSRSMFGKMIPDKKRTGEFFGFYDIFGKFSSIIGPSVVAFASAIAANALRAKGTVAEDLIEAAAAPWGVLSILIIFFIGGGLYFFVLPRYLKKKDV